jgi:ATP-dependent DNA helicase DinG
LVDQVSRILDELSELIAGKGAKPRLGQVDLAQSILSAMKDSTQFLAVGPVGVGKSFAYLVPAVFQAQEGKRTLISTNSLILQTQLIKKDIPDVLKVLEEDKPDRQVSVALIKGLNNYLCARKLDKHLKIFYSTDLDKLAEETLVPVELPENVENAVKQHFDIFATGLKEDTSIGELWNEVHATNASCISTKCPFFDVCKNQLAKRKAFDSDVVITNHTLLAFEILGKAKTIEPLGDFQNIVIDECHTLPETIRNTGTESLSVSLLKNVVKENPSLRILEDDIAGFESFLERACGELGSLETFTYDFDKGRTIAILDAICEKIKNVRGGEHKEKLEELRNTLSAFDLSGEVANDDHNITYVSKYANPTNAKIHYALCSATINTAYSLNSFWDEKSVTCVSATVNNGVKYDLGLKCDLVQFPNPFQKAYDESICYIPRVKRGEFYPLDDRGNFNTLEHQKACLEQVRLLVLHNAQTYQGGTLILGATNANVRAYANYLRKTMPGVTILAQTDEGAEVMDLIDKFKTSRQSVLVGTKSFMTGLDAKGDVLTTLIIDRMPRCPKNAIDEARKNATGKNSFMADTFVYAGDAGLLLEQASGRLIRSESDRGLIAVLDPRIYKNNEGGVRSYPKNTRILYQKPLSKFGKITDRLER